MPWPSRSPFLGQVLYWEFLFKESVYLSRRTHGYNVRALAHFLEFSNALKNEKESSMSGGKTDEATVRAKQFFESLRRRRSVRAFSRRPVSRETVECLIRAAGSAPSGANSQPWRFVCISGQNL